MTSTALPLKRLLFRLTRSGGSSYTVAEAVAVLELEGTVEELMFAIHAHPTLGEAMLDAYGAVEGMSINA